MDTMTHERWALVASVDALCWKFATKYHRQTGRDKDILHDVAVDGAIRAARLWDDSRGTKYATYATYAIQSSIWTHLKREGRRVDTPGPIDFGEILKLLPGPESTVPEADLSLTRLAVHSHLSPREVKVLRFWLSQERSSFIEMGRFLGTNRKAAWMTWRGIRFKIAALGWDRVERLLKGSAT